MRRLHYTSHASRDLVEIAIYIATQSGSRELALSFTERLREKCRHIASLPGTLGTARPELGHELRSSPCNGYVIFFRYQDKALEVVNILHGSRDVDSHFGEFD